MTAEIGMGLSYKTGKKRRSTHKLNDAHYLFQEFSM